MARARAADDVVAEVRQESESPLLRVEGSPGVMLLGLKGELR